jgi:SAM-dependent methyltransferase
MQTDIVDLREFYLSSLGLTVRRVLRARLNQIWPSIKGENLLALGFGTPLLRPFYHEANAIFAMMPAAQGVAYWPREGPNVSSLVDFENLPLADESIDRVLLLHAFEGVSDVHKLLREIWRVLKGSGRMLIVAPNRHGLWAHSDKTPFGHGEPYSGSQIRKTLHDQGFLINKTWRALYFPPTSSRLLLSMADFAEKYGEFVFPSFGGLLMAEASKQLYLPLLTKSKAQQRRLLLPLPIAASPPPIPAGRC